MQKYSNKQYNEIFYKLPREIQDVVASSNTTAIIRKIGEKYKLQLDMVENLINIVLDVLMGMISSKDIINEVVENCGLSRTDVVMLVKDLDDEIFKPIKELMMRLYSDGAPFKPNTLKTADEKDEDHVHLTQRDILKEIEDPVLVEPKKEVVLEAPSPKPNYSNFKTSPSKVVGEYHTEISLGKKIEEKNTKPSVGQENDLGVLSQKKPDYRSVSPTGISNIEEIKKRLLESIASQKLSGVFTMPNTSGEISSLPPKPQQSKKTVGAPIAPPIKKVEEVVKSGDPYREALK